MNYYKNLYTVSNICTQYNWQTANRNKGAKKSEMTLKEKWQNANRSFFSQKKSVKLKLIFLPWQFLIQTMQNESFWNYFNEQNVFRIKITLFLENVLSKRELCVGQ